MSHKLENYFLTYRKGAGLSQDEMAFLLGWSYRANVSSYEHFKRTPNLRLAFAQEVLFGASARDLCAGIYQDVERGTVERAQQLIEKLRAKKLDRTTVQKLNALNAAVERAERQADK